MSRQGNMILLIEENTEDHRNRLACKATDQRSVSCTLQLFGRYGSLRSAGLSSYNKKEAIYSNDKFLKRQLHFFGNGRLLKVEDRQNKAALEVQASWFWKRVRYSRECQNKY